MQSCFQNLINKRLIVWKRSNLSNPGYTFEKNNDDIPVLADSFGSEKAHWLLETLGTIPAMVLSLLVCYTCGCWWFSVYVGGIGIWGAVITCVLPYLIPDAAKIALAYTMGKRLRRHISHT